MTALLLILIAVLVLALVLILPWVRTLVRVNQTLVERGSDHRACIDHVAWHIRSEFASIVLNHAADQWDSIEAEKDRERLRREWQPGDGGVASLWMREQGTKWGEIHP